MFSIWHVVGLLLIVVLVFGTSKLRNIGSDLGSAVRNFKKGLDEGDDDKKHKEEQLRADPPPSVSSATQNQRDSSEPK